MRIHNYIPREYIDIIVHMERVIDKTIKNVAGETTETIRMSTCTSRDVNMY